MVTNRTWNGRRAGMVVVITIVAVLIPGCDQRVAGPTTATVVEESPYRIGADGLLEVRADMVPRLTFTRAERSPVLAELHGVGEIDFAPGSLTALRVPFEGIIESVEVSPGTRCAVASAAAASASVDLRRAKNFMEAARRHRLIPESPFADLACGPQTNEDRIEFVPRETIDRVIAACPDLEWQLIFAFARYEGLRIPSELAKMRWADVDWERNRITIYSPKVEHHAGRKYRVAPIFPGLRPYLEQAYREREPGQEFVVPGIYGDTNLGTEAHRIIEKAGFKPWEKTFVNLRGSCSDELEREYPAHVVDAWMGNSSRVRRRHYLKVTDADFERAAGYPAPYPAPSSTFTGHQEPSTLHESREKSLDVQKTAENQYPRQGSNL